jgi:uncharacterized protein (TIGR02328 family)
MRLWHVELIPYLDNKRLTGQWRELLAIKGAIDKNGTPNHGLVNKIMDYDIDVFKSYVAIIYNESLIRDFNFSKKKYDELMNWECDLFGSFNWECFVKKWHNDRYLRQNYFNLQEKSDNDMIPEKDWFKILSFYNTKGL